MVVVLNDQLHHLGNGIVPSAGHMIGNVGDFRPNHQTGFIAQVIEILIMLVVRQTDGGEAAFQDQINIFFVMLRQQRIAQSPPVLMAGNTPQGITFSVEDKTLFGVNFKGTAAKAGGDSIQNFPIFQQLCGHGVQIGILSAVPEAGVLNPEIGFQTTFKGADDLTVFVFQAVADTLAFLPILHPGLHSHFGIAALHNRCDLDARGAVIIQLKMAFGHTDQIYVPVQAAIEGKVCHLRINAVIGRIVHQNGQHVFITQILSQIHSPGGETAVMMGKVFAVQIYIGRGCGAANLQIILAGFRQVCLCDGFCVAAGTAEIVVSAVLAVSCIPGMRQSNGIPAGGQRGGDFRTILPEEPAVI